ncbi:hypothetical protein [Rudaea sp.]|uniref:hypothetical protein n=1 Tax=Rudaea sp. TaxID=2136325 RepID=UPI002ED43948
MSARDVLRWRNRRTAARPRLPAITNRLRNAGMQSRLLPSGETGIGENLYLQKSGISKYRIGTKWHRYTRLILDVVLLVTQ